MVELSFTSPPYIPPLTTPPFVRRIGALSQEIGFAPAVVDTLNRAGITFEVEGTLPDHHSGLILASDHRQRVEPLFAQVVMDAAQHPASRVLAMPTSFAGRLIQATGPEGKDLIIPIIPSCWSIDNKPSLTQPRAFLRRLNHPEIFQQPKDVLKVHNARSMQRAAGHVANGGALTTFPTGTLTEAADAPWRRGLGSIVQQLPPSAHETTQIAIMRPDTFSLRSFVSALALRDLGLHAKPQTIVLRTETLGSVKELFSEQLTDNPSTAQNISNIVRDEYIDRFSSHLS